MATTTAERVPADLLARVVERMRPEQVWLFGSRARGTADADSDWDLLVVLPDDAPDEALDPARAWDLVARGSTVPVDVVPVRSSEFARMRRYAGSLCRTVALEGVPIYGRPVPPNPVTLGYLDAASEDVDAATRLLAPPPSRLAAFHLQQAAEKLAKAVLSARGHHATREHRLGVLAETLEQGDPWRGRLRSLAHLDRFATAFRYPGTSGRLPAPPDAAAMTADRDAVRALVAEARAEAGIGR